MRLVFDIEYVIKSPDWAQWVAQDQDGIWWAYEVEPLQFHKGWYENEVGRNKCIGQGEKPINFKETLKRVNSE